MTDYVTIYESAKNRYVQGKERMKGAAVTNDARSVTIFCTK